MNKGGILFNQSFDKKRIKALVEWVFKTFGEKEALRVVEDLKTMGFKNATQAGISLGVHELTTPPDKPFLVSNAQIKINMTHHDFVGARITGTERSQRIVDTWHRVSETLRKQVVDYFSTYDKMNPIYIMALSGARGNFSQVRQLVGMRGLMADPQGKLISFPIRSNLREGLTLTEYFISCSGARKGLVDTALRTADTGYLTRRLVDVSHHIVVKRVACDTHKGILVKKLQSNNKTLLSLKDRLIGRVLAEHIKNTVKTEENGTNVYLQSKKQENIFLAKKDQEIYPELAIRISSVKQEVFIRSPLTCAFNHELCQLCYGWSLSQGNLVPLGEAVGVIAAQSIGEPGTQLTMRTFHTGGVFSGDLLQEIRASHSGKVYYSLAVQGLLIRTTHGKIAFLTKTPGKIVVLPDSHSIMKKEESIFSKEALRPELDFFQTPFQSLSMLFVRQGEHVEKNQLIAEVSNFGDEGNQSIKSQQTIFAELSGQVFEIQGGAFHKKYLDKEEENEENGSLRQIEPEKSRKLGLFKILSIGIGATFHPRLRDKKRTLYRSLTNKQVDDKYFYLQKYGRLFAPFSAHTRFAGTSKANPLTDLGFQSKNNRRSYVFSSTDPESCRTKIASVAGRSLRSLARNTGTKYRALRLPSEALSLSQEGATRQPAVWQSKGGTPSYRRSIGSDFFHLRTIAEEGDLVNEDYKKHVYPH